MDSVFQHVGSCGCFQVCHVLILQLVRTATSWALYLMVFGNYEPPWSCVTYVHNTTSRDFHYNSSFRTSFNQTSLNSSHSNVNPTLTTFMNSSATATNASTRITPGTCSRVAQCDEIVFDSTSVTVVSEFGLICDQAYIPQIIIAAQMLGMLVGSNAGGQLGEVLGRKINIYINLALMAAITIVASWSTCWEMHAAFSFFIGVGAGGIMCTQFVYAVEFLNPKWRGRLAALPVWNIALMLFVAVTYGLKNWRYIHLALGSLAALCVLSAFWLPESLRWLHVHGKDAETKKVLKKIMKTNNRRGSVSDVLEAMAECSKKESLVGRKYTYLDLFRTSEIRSLTLKSAFLWFTNNMCYYALSFSVKALSGDYYMNLFISCASEIPFTLIVAPCVNRLGRKRTVIIFMILSISTSIFCIVLIYVAPSSVSEPAIRFLAILVKGLVSVVWNAIQIFSVELFPTVIRNLSMGFSATVGRLGGVAASAIIPHDKQSMVVCFSVISGVLILTLTSACTLPETKDKPLADTIVTVDDDPEMDKEDSDDHKI